MGRAYIDWRYDFGHAEQFHNRFGPHLMHDLSAMHFDRDLAGAQFACDLFVQQTTDH
jgi:hypothetical protein